MYVTPQDVLSWAMGVLFGGMTLVQISPIKVNPWSAIAKWIGRALNGEVLSKVNALESEVRQRKSDADRREAIACRTRILHFGDEIFHSEKHSKEHFDQILRDITTYERYCEAHPEFENNTAVLTIERIEVVYKQCLANHNFL